MIPTILFSAHCSTLDWFYSLPTHVSQGFFLLQWCFSVLLPGLAAQPTVVHPPPSASLHTLYLLHTPRVQPPGKKAQCCFLPRVRFLLHAPCTCYMVQNLRTIHSRVWSSWVFINLSMISYHFYQAISSTEVEMSSIFCSPSQSQLLEQCQACGRHLIHILNEWMAIFLQPFQVWSHFSRTKWFEELLTYYYHIFPLVFIDYIQYYHEVSNI